MCLLLIDQIYFTDYIRCDSTDLDDHVIAAYRSFRNGSIFKSNFV